MRLRRRAATATVRPDYTPPSWSEFAAILGPDSFEHARAYDSMCLAMSCHTYDREEAYRRLHGIAESDRRFKESFAKMIQVWRERGEPGRVG